MLLLVDVIIGIVDLGLVAGHLYPILLEQPTMIVLDLVTAVTHCVVIGHHIARHNKR